MRWAEDMGYIQSEQAAKIKIPAKEEKIVNMLNKDETKVLLNSQAPSVMHNKLRNKILMEIFVYSGSRVSAVCALTPADINFVSNTITFKKTKRNKEYVAFIEQELTDSIRKYIEHIRPSELSEQDPLFVGERKINGKWQQISRQGLYNVTKGYTERITGNSVSPHQLRHTSASIQLDQGVPIDMIQDNLNHAQLNTTEIYAQRFTNNARREQTLNAFANL
ncbi:MAG: tyrosine-type recombinase/integrase [Aminipila sp.]